IDAEIHRDLDRLVEFRLGALLDELDRLIERVGLRRVDAFAGLGDAFSSTHDQAPTWMPIDRADPSTMRIADSTVSQLRSAIFFSAISLTCALVTLATLSRPGVFEPPSILAAFLRKYDIGGVRISKVNDLSP